MDGIEYGSITVSKISNDFVQYSFEKFTINVKNLSETDSPKMYKDQKGYIHFETKYIHVWYKNVLPNEKA